MAEALAPLEAIPVGKRLRLHEHAEMIARYNDLRKRGRNHKEACEEIAPLFERTASGVNYIIRRYQPTTDLAQHILTANAARLAMRVVRKANVAEAIDLLSRKSMGVISPKMEEGAGNQGFFLSVQADSCGAVKVGVQITQAEPLDSSPAEPDIIECNGYTLMDEPETPSVKEKVTRDSTFQGHIGKNASRPENEWSQKTQRAIQAARDRITKAHVQRNRASAKLRDSAKDPRDEGDHVGVEG